MRDIRDYFGLTNDYITNKAQSSSGTTERIMDPDSAQDVMRSTARRYEQAEIGPVGEFTCYLDYSHTAEEQVEALQAEVAALREKVADLKEEKVRLSKIIDKLINN